jgi:hypothetical protein
VTLHIDNQSAIAMILNPEFHQKTKHIEIQYHFIRDEVETRTLQTQYIPTKLQAADIMTKVLGRVLHEKGCKGLGLIDR